MGLDHLLDPTTYQLLTESQAAQDIDELWKEIQQKLNRRRISWEKNNLKEMQPKLKLKSAKRCLRRKINNPKNKSTVKFYEAILKLTKKSTVKHHKSILKLIEKNQQ